MTFKTEKAKKIHFCFNSYISFNKDDTLLNQLNVISIFF